MKKFKGNRPREEIKKAVLESGGEWNEVEYNKGSDWTYFTYQGRQVAYGFMGRFMVREGDKVHSERSNDMDQVDWYSKILDLLYVTEKGS